MLSFLNFGKSKIFAFWVGLEGGWGSCSISACVCVNIDIYIGIGVDEWMCLYKVHIYINIYIRMGDIALWFAASVWMNWVCVYVCLIVCEMCMILPYCTFCVYARLLMHCCSLRVWSLSSNDFDDFPLIVIIVFHLIFINKKLILLKRRQLAD